MRFVQYFCGIVLAGYLLIASGSMAATHAQRFDLVYVWDSDYSAIFDYKEVLAGVLDAQSARHLKMVKRGGEYGLIYDMNGTKRQASREIVRQTHGLLAAGLGKAKAIPDNGSYSQLYNICYGYSPNLNVLKGQYHQMYARLGKDIGHRLAIERASGRGYALVYRMHAVEDKAASLMEKHKRMLRPAKVPVTLTVDNNNPLVYGESSLLNKRLASGAGNGQSPTAQAPQPLAAPLAAKPSDSKTFAAPAPVGAISEQGKKSCVVHQTDILDKPIARVGLEKTIGDLINDLYRQGHLERNERSAWMVYDVENGQPLVNINGNQLFQAASMIKPFIALAFFHQVQAGKLSYTPQARQMVERMIQHSSNEAANWVMRQAGGPDACTRILRGNYSQILRRTQIVEYIPPGGKTYRNKVIPSDYARFLAALWDMKLPYSEEMRRVMALPKGDRIYKGTTIPKGILVYNKTGSTARLCGDMGILVPPPKSGTPAYAMVGVIERDSGAGDYSAWIRRRGNVIRQVSSLVYKEIGARR